MNNEYLIKSHISRLGTILSKYAIVLLIFTILIMIATFGQALLMLAFGLSIFLWFILGIVLLGLPFLDPTYRSYVSDTPDKIMNDNGLLAQIQVYIPHMVITFYVLIILSFILFLISKKIPRSKNGLVFTSIVIIATILVLGFLLLCIIAVANN